jgi:hypothetical protein
MLADITQSSKSFLIFWEEEYQQIYDNKNGFHPYIDFDQQLFENRFSKLNKDVIYVADVNLHTLFQDISYFQSYFLNSPLLISPILVEEKCAIGLAGIILNSDENESFDNLVNQLETVGAYIGNLYQEYKERHILSHQVNFNLDNLPVSFFQIDINQQAELVKSNFSKNLLRKHPACVHEYSQTQRVEGILSMSIMEFYTLIMRIKDNQNIEYVYSFVNQNGEKKYYLIKIHISKLLNNQFCCLGLIEDFTVQRNFESVLDQIIFDISHVMRRPVVSMKGLTNLIDMDQLDKKDLFEITEKIKVVSEEMEQYIGAMFKIYEARQDELYNL